MGSVVLLGDLVLRLLVLFLELEVPQVDALHILFGERMRLVFLQNRLDYFYCSFLLIVVDSPHYEFCVKISSHVSLVH